MKRCLICFEDLYKGVSILDYFSFNDCICGNCRSKMQISLKEKKIEDLEILTLYEYDTFMESLLFQFKEGRDIALKEVFFKKWIPYINTRFKGWTIVYMPSSKKHCKERGFIPLEEMLKHIQLEKIELFEKTTDYKQSSRSYIERKEVRKVMKLKDGVTIFPKKLLFVDDVVTSGNTLLSAYELVKGKAEIKALVLCDNHINDEESKVKKDFIYWLKHRIKK